MIEADFLLGLMCLLAMALAAVTAVAGLTAAMVAAAGFIAVHLVGWCLYRTGRGKTRSTDDPSSS